MPTAAASPPPVPRVVERAREYCRAALEDAVGRLTPDLARICGYHLGWCHPDGAATARRGSRSMQAAMVMLAAEATGADPALARPGAVAVELIHNYALIHDDIIDDDQIRRDRPTAWVVFGTGPAVVAGNALCTAAFEALLAVEGPTGHLAARVLTSDLTSMIDGWASEWAFDRMDPRQVRMEDYLTLSENKTAAMLGAAPVLGTVLCGKPQQEARSLRQAARLTGLAWQAMNDVESIWADPALTGKPAFQDLRDHKNTLPVIAAMQSGHAQVATLATLLRKESLTEDDLHQAAESIEASGGRAFAERIANENLGHALAIVDGLALSRSLRDELAELLEFAVTRTPRTRTPARIGTPSPHAET